MSPGIVRVSLFLILALPCAPQDGLSIVRDWQPSSVGDRWTYEREIRSGDRNHPDIERWEVDEVTVAIETVAQGTLLRRAVVSRNTSNPPRWLHHPPRPESNVLISKNCIYDLSRYPQADPLKDFTSDWLPDVCFPLLDGITWGDPNKGRDLWTVAGRGKKHPDDPASVTPVSWRLEAGLASGDDNYVWFRQGVGLIAERTWHNGTYTDESVRLIRFQPARP
jgi:hypothetical protein